VKALPATERIAFRRVTMVREFALHNRVHTLYCLVEAWLTANA
jgi:hypothetical protein